MLDLEKRSFDLKISGDYSGALQLRLELELLHSQLNSNPSRQSRNLNQIAYLGVHLGKLREAERAAGRCLEIYRPISVAPDETLATYLFMLAAVLAESGKFDEAVSVGEEAVAIFAERHGEDSSFVQFRKKDIMRMRNKDTAPYLDR